MTDEKPTEHVKPQELFVAARMADGLVWIVGMAGVVAGALLFRENNVPFALIAWTLTFVAGVSLRLVVWMARGIAQMMTEQMTIRHQMSELRSDLARDVSTHPDQRYP